MSKPYIANAILNSAEEQEEQLVNEDQNIRRLNNYLKTIPLDRYPPVIQQAVKDIRYISETQREAQKDDLVCFVFIFLTISINTWRVEFFF